MYIHVYAEKEKERFLFNWLTWLWKPNPAELTCSSCLKASRLKTQEELIFFSPGPKARKDRCLGSVRREESLLHRLFVLVRSSADRVRPTHSREGTLLYSVYQFKR